MRNQEAIAFCEQRREALEIDPDMRPESAELAIVRYKKDPDNPGPAQDRRAWIVTYSCPWGMVYVHIDDARQQVLTVKRTP